MKPKHVKKKDLREISRRLSELIEEYTGLPDELCFIAADLDLLLDGE
jgi:hypothetical protein